MEFGINDSTTNTQTWNSTQNIVFYIDPAGYQTWDLRDGDNMKTGKLHDHEGPITIMLVIITSEISIH